MILVCSRGHEFDMDKWEDRYYWGTLVPGQRCPQILAYERMSGSQYCRRVLRVKKEGADERRGSGTTGKEPG